jgi:molybdate/tungstate transport system permease protein
MYRNRSFNTIFILLAIILVFFIGYPIFLTLTGSPLKVFWETFLDAQVQESILFTFSSSLIATGIGLLTGIPLAYLLARNDFPGKRLVEGVIDLPIVIPHSAAGIALLMALGRQSVLGQGFASLGLRFVSGSPGVVAAMLFVSVPFLVDAAREGFESVDPHLEYVARTLGSSAWGAFWRVTFPMAWRSIISGLIMMWARGISEFGAVVILTYHPMIAPILLYERFQSFGLDYALPVAGLVILISMIVFLVLRSLSQAKENS